jgi:sulfide:quinone oxidoreductase
MPVVSSAMTAADAATLGTTLAKFGATGKTPVLAYCRSGTRSQRLFDMAAALAPAASPSGGGAHYDVVIVGGGALVSPLCQAFWRVTRR